MNVSRGVIGSVILLALFLCGASSADIANTDDDSSPFNPVNLVATSIGNDPDHYAKFQGVFKYTVTVDLGGQQPFVEKGYVFIHTSHAWLVPDFQIQSSKIDPLKMDLAKVKLLATERCFCFWSSPNSFQMIGMARSGRLDFLNVTSWQGSVRGETIAGPNFVMSQESNPPKPIHGTFSISPP